MEQVSLAIEFVLARYGLEATLWRALAAALIFITSLVMARCFNKLVSPVLLKFIDWTPGRLDSRIINGLRLPLTLAIVLAGAYLAVVLPFDLAPVQQDAINRATEIAGIALGILTAASMVSHTFNWYISRTTSSPQSNGAGLLPLFRRISVGLVFGVGALVIIDQAGQDVTLIIAGLGLWGLAVALALQPALSNLFAGTYVMTEGVVKPGDYVELEHGPAGWVVDVSWRSTRIRTFYNNLVIVPNSRFAEMVLTNYQEPTPPVNILVKAGVSLDSDLHQVERVCYEVMDEVLETSPYGVKEFGSWFGFENIGESNVEFWLFIQAKDRIASFGLRTDLMKQLFGRFRKEGITINYPVRSLRLSQGLGLDAMVSQPNSAASFPSNSRSQRSSSLLEVHFPSDTGQGPEGSNELVGSELE